MKKKILDYGTKIQALAYHDMFNHIEGNPTSVQSIAALSNANLEHEDDSDMNELIHSYKKLRSEQEKLSEQINANQNFKHKVVERKFKNNMSLKISTDCSVQSLNKDARDFLCLLGCLPGGVKDHQLNEIGYDHFQVNLEQLEKLHFLDNGVQRHVLTPFILFYCQESFNEQAKIDCLDKLIYYYKRFLIKIFDDIEHGTNWKSLYADNDPNSG